MWGYWHSSKSMPMFEEQLVNLDWRKCQDEYKKPELTYTPFHSWWHVNTWIGVCNLSFKKTFPSWLDSHNRNLDAAHKVDQKTGPRNNF